MIVIIGILSAIAIGAFLNQRKKANDAAVESDVRAVSIAIETALVDNPNATTITGSNMDNVNALGNTRGMSGGIIASINPHNVSYNLYASGAGNNQIVLSVDGERLESPVNLSPGVSIHVRTVNGDSANHYEIKGWYDNGKSYVEDSPLTYDSTLGGFTDDTTPVASGPGGDVTPGPGLPDDNADFLDDPTKAPETVENAEGVEARILAYLEEMERRSLLAMKASDEGLSFDEFHKWSRATGGASGLTFEDPELGSVVTQSMLASSEETLYDFEGAIAFHDGVYYYILADGYENIQYADLAEIMESVDGIKLR